MFSATMCIIHARFPSGTLNSVACLTPQNRRFSTVHVPSHGIIYSRYGQLTNQNLMKKLIVVLLFSSSPFILRAQTGLASFFDTQKNHILYEVNKNDKSLWSICKRFGLTLEQVKKENSLKNNDIKTGDTLKLPTHYQKEKELIIHVVRKEDISLWNICNQYLVKPAQIVKLNKKENNQITIGETLLIPSLKCRNQNFEIINKEQIFSSNQSYLITKRMHDVFSMNLTPIFEIFKLKENRFVKILEIACHEEKSFRLFDFDKDGFKDILVNESVYSENLKCTVYLYQPLTENCSNPTYVKNCP